MVPSSAVVVAAVDVAADSAVVVGSAAAAAAVVGDAGQHIRHSKEEFGGLAVEQVALDLTLYEEQRERDGAS